MQYLKRCGFPGFLLAIVLLVPAAWADQLVLKNGDRVTGSIVKKDDKNITVKTEHFGVVVIPWDQVDSIVADKPIHFVRRDGKAVQGTISAAGDALADIAVMRNDAEELAYQRLLRPGWGDLWAGTGTVGFAGTAGNAKTLTFTMGVNADRVTNTDKTSLYFSLIKASARINDQSEDTAEAVRGGIGYSHNVGSRLFFNAFNDYEYDRFQNLDLRFVLGGGLGYHLWKTEKSKLDLLAGGAYNRSSFSTPFVRNSGELYWGDDYSLKLGSNTTLIQSYRMFNDMGDTGIYRVNFDIGLNTKIFKALTWNVSLSDRYLSRPAPDRKKNDFLYTTGLGISFAK